MARRRLPLWQRILRKLYYDGKWIGLIGFAGIAISYIISQTFAENLSEYHPSLAASLEQDLQDVTIAAMRISNGSAGSPLSPQPPNAPQVLGAGIQGLFEIVPRSVYVQQFQRALLDYCHGAWHFVKSGFLLWLCFYRLIADVLRLTSPHLYPKLRALLLVVLAVALIVICWQPLMFLEWGAEHIPENEYMDRLKSTFARRASTSTSPRHSRQPYVIPARRMPSNSPRQRTLPRRVTRSTHRSESPSVDIISYSPPLAIQARATRTGYEQPFAN